MPKKTGEKEKVNIAVPKKVKDRLREMADERGVNLTSMINQIIYDWMEGRKEK